MEPTTLDEVMINEIDELYPADILEIEEDGEDIDALMMQEQAQEEEKLF